MSDEYNAARDHLVAATCLAQVEGIFDTTFKTYALIASDERNTYQVRDDAASCCHGLSFLGAQLQAKWPEFDADRYNRWAQSLRDALTIETTMAQPTPTWWDGVPTWARNCYLVAAGATGMLIVLGLVIP